MHLTLMSRKVEFAKARGFQPKKKKKAKARGLKLIMLLGLWWGWIKEMTA